MPADAVMTFTVPPDQLTERADKLLARYYPEVSRSRIQKAFEKGQVRLNGAVIHSKCRAAAGDKLLWTLPSASNELLKPVPLPLDILYEDASIIVLNKASGQIVHPGTRTGTDTLVHALLHHCGGKLRDCGEPDRPGVVHRLDKETSGVLVFAKTELAYERLKRMFATRTVKKKYLALVSGVPGLRSGTIRKAIARHPTVRIRMCVVEEGGRSAHTDWQVETAFGQTTALLSCFPVTGRTHQIRVHLSAIGHPILGDRTYGYRPPRGLDPLPKRVQLHAHQLQLQHPVTGIPLRFEAPLAHDFQALAEAYRHLS